MSELQKRWAKAKLDSFGGSGTQRGIGSLQEEDESGSAYNPADYMTRASFDDDSSSASSSSASSTGTIVPSVTQSLFARPHGAPRANSRTLDPIPWTSFFERELFLDSGDLDEPTESKEESKEESKSKETVIYHAYITSPVDKGPLFVMHHGAGSSGLSFAVVSAEIRKRLPSAGILSLDARDHGLTKVEDAEGKQPPVDLSLHTLSSDLLAVIRLAQKAMHWPEVPPLVLVGHSLGGAVVTDLAFSSRLDTLNSPKSTPLLGFAVLDVVEGSAIDALQSMQTYLGTRPPGFPTLQAGIEWHIRTRTVRNNMSARTSVPALLVDHTLDDATETKTETEEDTSTISEMEPPASPASAKARPWRWRTDLGATQPFWEDWFVGLSKKFLGSRGGKLLLLAGTDRLDTELTIGQMQGKYALQVFPEAGHFIHEDLPEKTALTLVDFYQRNNRNAIVLPPKVSELLAQGKKV